MHSMVERQALAIAAGVGLAIIIQESVWIGWDALIPRHSLNKALLEAPTSDGWLTPLLAAWLAGGAFGGLMSTLIGRSRFSGHATGLLLSAGALLLAVFALPEAGSFLVIAGTPGAGSALGAGLGVKLLDSEHVQYPGRLRPPPF